MDNSLVFKLDLKEMMSGALRKMEGITHSVFRNVDKSIISTQRNLNDLGKSHKINVDTSGIREAGREVDNLNNKLRNLGGGGMGFAGTAGAMGVGTLAANGISRAMSAALQQGMSVLDAGMTAGMVRTQMETLAGKGPGSALYGDLTKYIQESIFGPELYKEATTMMAYGVAPGSVMPSIKMLGDISGGDPAKLHSLSYAYSQTQAYGKLRGNEMVQYGDAGVNPSKLIGAMLHKSDAEMEKLISAGKISSDMVTKAFEQLTSPGGKFYKMLENIAQTPYGKQAAMAGNIEVAKTQFGEALMPAYGMVLDAAKPLIDQLPAALKDLQPTVEKLGKDFADMLKWSAENTETIKMWIGLVKVGAEAWVAWKVGTMALTAANSALNTSIAGTAAETKAVAAGITTENALLAEQTVLVKNNEFAWLAMGKAELAAMDAAALRAATTSSAAMAAAQSALPNAAGIAAAARGTAVGAVSMLGSIATTVGIAYFADQALSQMSDTYAGVSGAVKTGAAGVLETAGNALARIPGALSDTWDYWTGNKKEVSTILDTPAEALSFEETRARMMAGQIKGIDGVKPTMTTSTPMSIAGSDTITGGGSKRITINYNAPLYKVDHQTFNSVAEAIKDFEPKIKEVLLRTLAAAPGAI